jgi:hypothetical protein
MSTYNIGDRVIVKSYIHTLLDWPGTICSADALTGGVHWYWVQLDDSCPTANYDWWGRGNGLIPLTEADFANRELPTSSFRVGDVVTIKEPEIAGFMFVGKPGTILLIYQDAKQQVWHQTHFAEVQGLPLVLRECNLVYWPLIDDKEVSVSSLQKFPLWSPT